MRPGAPLQILLAWESDVHAVERAEKLVGAPKRRKRFEHFGLGARLPTCELATRVQPLRVQDLPDKFLVCAGVREVHTTLEAHGEVFLCPCRLIVGVEAAAK